jgi:sortase (surface protein transpeptidase)
LKWDAVGSILKQTKRKHQLTIKTCTKYVDKKSPVMRPNLQPKIYKSPVVV